MKTSFCGGGEIGGGPIRPFVLACSLVILATLGNGVALCQWHNTSKPEDVNADSFISPEDTLIIINELHENNVSDPNNGALPTTGEGPFFFDVTNDGFVNPLDALITINNQDHPPLAGPPPGVVPQPGEADLQLRPMDLDGNAISQVQLGGEFVLSGVLVDTRTDFVGVATAYGDVNFDVNAVELTEVLGPVDQGAGTVGVLNGGVLAGVGGDGMSLDSFSEREVFRLQFKALELGQTEISPSNGYALILGLNEGVTPTYQSASLLVVPEPCYGPWALLGLACLVRRSRKRSAREAILFS